MLEFFDYWGRSSLRRYTLELDTAEFLRKYWQQRPCVIRGGLPDFVDPLDGNDLAGLAADPQTDSRLVVKSGDKWQLLQEALDDSFDYASLGETDWTLLVQAVDHWLPDAAALVAPFRFLPNWRIDDLMVSFSAPGGGVGPHTDQYDVFIIQGQGRRHWRVGQPQPLKQHYQAGSLLQVESFEACIDVELEPGDILYIPPNCPHEGYALEPSLNYSVGFRAPSSSELVASLADHLVEHGEGNNRFTDAKRKACLGKAARVSQEEQQQLVKHMQQVLNQPQLLESWLLQSLSEPTRELAFPQPEHGLEAEAVLQLLSAGEVFTWLGGVRILYGEENSSLFVNGEPWPVPNTCWHDACLLADSVLITADTARQFKTPELAAEQIARWYNRGWLELGS